MDVSISMLHVLCLKNQSNMVSRRNFTLSACRQRAVVTSVVVGRIWRRRVNARSSSFSTTLAIQALRAQVEKEIEEQNKIQARSYMISTTDFSFDFNAFGDSECLW